MLIEQEQEELDPAEACFLIQVLVCVITPSHPSRPSQPSAGVETAKFSKHSLVLFHLLHVFQPLITFGSTLWKNKYIDIICGFFPFLCLCPSFSVLSSLLSGGLLPFLFFQ